VNKQKLGSVVSLDGTTIGTISIKKRVQRQIGQNQPQSSDLAKKPSREVGE
jgi:hypothetical protein